MELIKVEKITIGTLAQKANVNVETVRYYERRGLLEKPKKLGAFRYYPLDYVAKINFIKKAQALGFNLHETLQILQLQKSEKSVCQDILKRTEQKITQINEKISDLKKIKKTLKQLADYCGDVSLPLKECTAFDQFMNEKES